MSKAKYIEYNDNTGEITNVVVMEESMESNLAFKNFVKCPAFFNVKNKQIDLNTKELVEKPVIEEKKVIPLFEKMPLIEETDYLKSLFYSHIFQIIQLSLIIILLWRK